MKPMLSSSMSISIGDPFLLSTYSVPRKPSSFAGNVASSLANVYATHENGLSPEGHVVVAAQGDGVHILDVSVNNSIELICNMKLKRLHILVAHPTFTY
jgi:hypothetical protein